MGVGMGGTRSRRLAEKQSAEETGGRKHLAESPLAIERRPAADHPLMHALLHIRRGRYLRSLPHGADPVTPNHLPAAGLEALPEGAGGAVKVVADDDGGAGLRAGDGGHADAGAVGRRVGGVGLRAGESGPAPVESCRRESGG